jgi:hypothetical protein
VTDRPSGPDLVGYLNRIAAKYQLAPEAFLDLFAKQHHRCAICRRALTLFAEDLAEAPVVDHEHGPDGRGPVRGILCRGCNTAVGYIEKDRVRTRKVLGYLRNSMKKRGESWREAREAGRGWAKSTRKMFVLQKCS